MEQASFLEKAALSLAFSLVAGAFCAGGCYLTNTACNHRTEQPPYDTRSPEAYAKENSEIRKFEAKFFGLVGFLAGAGVCLKEWNDKPRTGIVRHSYE
jgi:hypothetical protein